MSQWHVPPPTMKGWVEGRTSLSVSASVEQHLLACAACRADVAAFDGSSLGADLDAVWLGVREQVEPPRRLALARLLCRLGVSDGDADLVAATPSLSLPWIAAMAVVLAFAAIAGVLVTGGEAGLFLLIAPLVPVAGVAVAYGAEVDPIHEVALATPSSQLRLLLLRTAVVLAVCTPITLVMSLVLPGPWWLGVVWLVPASAFVSLTLAAATFVEPVHAATAIAVGWAAFMLPSILHREPLAAFNPTVLAWEVAVTVMAVAVLSVRSSRLSIDRRSR